MENNKHHIAIFSKGYYPLLLFLVSFVFVTLFSRSTSFLYYYEGFDAAIFKQMGLALLRGKTLYVDYFDNKGCILYFIQALGLFLGGNSAILLMQALSLTITLILWDKIIAFYREGRSRLICLALALFFVLCFYDGGNLSEEWSLPFASYPIYLYFRSLKTNKEIKKWEMLAIGLCFGIIAFIRINNASAFLGFVIYLFVVFLLNKDFKKFITNALFVLLGIALVTGGCVLYFYLKAGSHGVNEMLYGTFLSYFEYFDYQIPQTLYHYVFYIIFVAVCISVICINNHRNKEVLVPTLLSYAIFICTSGNRCFTHYLMVTTPLLVVGLMTLDLGRHRKIHLVLALLTVMPLLSYLARPVGFFFNDLILRQERFKTSYSEFHRCIEGIPEAERDSIYNYNLSGIGAGMMQHEGLLQCNRVFFSPLAFHLPGLQKEEAAKPLTLPKWIMIASHEEYDENDLLFIAENYEMKYQFDHNAQYVKRLNMGESHIVYFYCRKD